MCLLIVKLMLAGEGVDDIHWDPQQEGVKNGIMSYCPLTIAYISVNGFIFISLCIYLPCLIIS